MYLDPPYIANENPTPAYQPIRCWPSKMRFVCVGVCCHITAAPAQAAAEAAAAVAGDVIVARRLGAAAAARSHSNPVLWCAGHCYNCPSSSLLY